MYIRLSVRDADGFARDVALDAPPGAVLDDVSTAITALLPQTAGGDGVWSGSHRLPPSAMLGGPGLRDGDVLTLGQAGDRDLTAGAVLRLHVTGGPDAGLIVALPRGVTTVGRGPMCDVTLTDPDVSRQHATITVTTAGISVRDLDSTNGTLLDGAPVDADGASLESGQLLRLGESLLSVLAADEPAAAVRPGPDGTRLVNRPPRLAVRLPDREVAFPARATTHGPQRVQWLAALLPAGVGVGLALAMHSVQFLAFALLSPIVILGTALGDRLHWRRERRREATGFRRRNASAEHDRSSLIVAEVAYRRRAHPDPAAVFRTATIPDCRLWERRRTDPDLLDVRLGVADQPATLQMRRGQQLESAGVASLVPAVVNLRSGPIGVVGPTGITLGVSRWVVSQLAALHSPGDLSFVLLLSDAAAPAWTWSRWLPHLHEVATTAEQRASVVAELGRIVDERRNHGHHDHGRWAGPWTVLVVDRSGALADVPGLSRVLEKGAAVGITAICLDDEQRRLPTACRVVARVCGETGSRLDVQSAAGPSTDVLADRVGTRWAERVARALAPLADAGADAASAIPESCRLLELLELLELGESMSDDLIARWRTGRPDAVVGLAADGPFHVDLDRDGPHALVAGTTGAGKSELLQSWIAALASGNSPEAVTFVLIDYKGGAAFADCARLPHSVGLVTDLDPHLTRRALQSLDAELRRREQLFAEAHVKDLADYRNSPHHQVAPIGRLVLIVDEFAALAEELPEFVSGLVAIAQRGRSLGVHLVLATQRPGGVISPEIRANTSLRIALRVTDPGESADVVGSDVAATIDKNRPGRAYVLAGPSLTEVQIARVAGIAPNPGASATVTPLDEWGRRTVEHAADPGDKTDLQLLVDAICEAAARCELPTPRSPWLSPLPAELPMSVLDVPDNPWIVPVGQLDRPTEQRQTTLCVDLRVAGPTLLIGGPRSGRTAALRTLAGSAAARHSSNELHLYVVDCTGAGLRTLGDLPHCGTVITRDEFGLVERLLGRLSDEIRQRQAVLAEIGASSVTDARDRGVRMPFICLIVDGWEAFVTAADENDAGRSADVLLTLLRESAAVGITVVVSGDRAALTARVSGSVARRYVLRMADRADYALAGIPPGAVPVSLPPGRGVCAESGSEVQFAFLGDDPSLAAQQRAVAEIAATASQPDPDLAPFTLRALPTRVVREALSVARADATLLGVAGDEAAPIAVDLFAGDARLLIAGPPRSGRTTALRLILEQSYRRDDLKVVVAGPRRCALVASAEQCGVQMVTPDDPPALARAISERPLLLLVDDSEVFLDTPIGDALTDLVRSSPGQLAAVVAARSEELAVTYRGIASEVRRSRSGLLLQPGPGDGELLGLQLGRTRSARLPGRGVLAVDPQRLCGVSDGRHAIPIQIALP